MYKTPQEAIAACEAECVRSWEEFVKLHMLNTPENAKSMEAGKAIFRVGYMSGARFVSGAMVEKLMAHGKTHVIQPNEQS
jgi:hypothetical protein